VSIKTRGRGVDVASTSNIYTGPTGQHEGDAEAEGGGGGDGLEHHRRGGRQVRGLGLTGGGGGGGLPVPVPGQQLGPAKLPATSSHQRILCWRFSDSWRDKRSLKVTLEGRAAPGR
jgi:hypothetical protein